MTMRISNGHPLFLAPSGAILSHPALFTAVWLKDPMNNQPRVHLDKLQYSTSSIFPKLKSKFLELPS